MCVLDTNTTTLKKVVFLVFGENPGKWKIYERIWLKKGSNLSRKKCIAHMTH